MIPILHHILSSSALVEPKQVHLANAILSNGETLQFMVPQLQCFQMCITQIIMIHKVVVVVVLVTTFYVMCATCPLALFSNSNV